ncbi:hypothetical protein [Aquimarina sp. MMG016]|uniref:hypothetical protein n=1 Tax=Aquimarina sp. MMG016 TaxID=2822690 RepID=UPI001B3A6796|nr:hypothetical protein [Aquimarina sp. MMG016]MBQ4821599.1 hypothetical protein [Aquimarina sp. MMG016]
MPGIKETKISKIAFLIFLVTTTISCQKNEDTNLIKINSLPHSIREVSGITMLPDNHIYAINDSGNDNTLFRLNKKGEIINKLTVPKAKNVDWEDLAYDQENNIYIGDFGNNGNDRKNLRIYKVSGILSDSIVVTKIKFSFEDQKKFPPKKKNFNFDVEAFIYLKGNLYLFTKNRGSIADATTKLYKIPATQGKHTAKLIGSFKTCDDKSDCLITAAAINSYADKIALLTHNKVFLLSNFKKDNLFGGDIKKIKLHHYSQKEGICFKNDSILYITDEGTKHKKAGLYEYSLN